MRQIFDADMKYLEDAVDSIEAIVEDLAKAGVMNIALSLGYQVSKIKSVIKGASE